MHKKKSNYICPKVIKIGSIIGYRIGHNRVGVSEMPVAHTKQKLNQLPPAGCEWCYAN